MKYIVYIFIFFIFSCGEKKSEDKLEIIYDSSQIDSIDRSDGYCLSELWRAKIDYNDGILVHTLHEIYNPRYVYKEEISLLLEEKGIQYIPLGEACLPLPNCYGYFMDSVILAKFGNNFIDSILTEAKKLSDSKWKTKIYPNIQVDSEAYYVDPLDERSANRFIKKKITLPSNWEKTTRNAGRQFCSFRLIIMPSGKAQLHENDMSFHIKNNNEKHIPSLKKQIMKAINEMKAWEPAVVDDHKVKSIQYIDVNLDN